MKIVNNIPVWGDPIQNAVDQMAVCLEHTADWNPRAALMADHHLGYSVPVGGVLSLEGAITPSGVGFDIACGNKAVELDAHGLQLLGSMDRIMDDIVKNISFGVGRINKTEIDHPLFDSPVWDQIEFLKGLKPMAHQQLGTVGSGNHYVDVFTSAEDDRVWIGCHFGSRGLGHKIATHYIKAAGGKDGINVPPAILDVNSDLGREYIAAMNLAGEYAYAGRDWVCQTVANIIGANITDEVHNHHNFAWLENGRWVVRKGATPNNIGQRGFIGGSMVEKSYIVTGSKDCALSMNSTVHGAGRVMSRTEAAGKFKWKKGVRTRVSDGKITQAMMDETVRNSGVVLRGGGPDESSFCYKRLDDCLWNHHAEWHSRYRSLIPMGVAMAGCDIVDPYKD